MNRNRVVWLRHLALATFLLFGCRLFSGSNPAASYGVERETAVFLTAGQPQTLDPALTHGGPAGAIGHIFGGLVTLNADLQVQPALAAGWQLADDGVTYTFYLRRDAVFHDGRPVTAADVIFSWTRATDPTLGSDTAATYLGDIVGVADRLAGRTAVIDGLRSIDDHTLEVRIDAPKVYFLAKLTYPVAYIVDREQVGDAAWERTPNGTGPFRLQVWEDDEILILARHEAYWEPATLAHVVYQMGAGLPLAMYETDEIDLVGVGGRTLERMRDPNNPLAAELRTGVSFCTSTIGLDNRRPPFDDARVRQAFNYALDNETLIDTLANGDALVADGPLPPGMPGFVARARSYPFEPERARALLVEAGYGDGLPPLTYSAPGYDDAGALISAAVSLWTETLGADIEVVLVDPFEYYDQLYDGQVGHIFSSGWCADYPDPENFLDILYHSQSVQNAGGYANSAVDATLEAARVEADVTERLALYAAAEAQIIAEAPAIFLWHDLQAVLVKPWLQGYELTPIGVAQWQNVSVVSR